LYGYDNARAAPFHVVCGITNEMPPIEIMLARKFIWIQNHMSVISSRFRRENNSENVPEPGIQSNRFLFWSITRDRTTCNLCTILAAMCRARFTERRCYFGCWKLKHSSVKCPTDHLMRAVIPPPGCPIPPDAVCASVNHPRQVRLRVPA